MKLMLLAATALVVLGSAGYAQTSTSGSNSQSTATNSSASQASSVSNPRVNIIGASTGTGTSSSVSGSRSVANTQSSSQSASVGNRSNVIVNTYAGISGSGSSGAGTGDRSAASNPSSGDPTVNSNVNYSGGYTVRNVPEVVAPNIVGGNPCAIGASGGLAVSGFGITGGATWADKQCERRQQAALLYNIGKQRAAVELMCQDDNVRAALRVSGEPCTADQAVAQQPMPIAAVPLAPVMATPAAPVATPVRAAAPVAVRAARPEWCYTASGAEMRRHAECDVRS